VTAFPPAVSALLAKVPLAPLGPGSPVAEVRAELAAVVPTLTPGCQSGLWLAFGYWDEAHAVAQDLPTPDGSFWHAILHRREPDAWNSKYWFRQVGNHPVMTQLREQCPALGYTFTNACDFVDFCERVRDTGSAEEEVARQVQALEWRLQFAHCFRATGR
jgi:hypothetical protein